MRKHFSKRAKYNLALLALSLVYVFVIGLFDPLVTTQFVYYIVITAIYLLSVFAANESRTRSFYLPVFVIIMTWVTMFFNLPFLSEISSVISTLFFLYIIVFLVISVARSKEVGPQEFMESINVYLLLGIAGSILFRTVYSSNPAAFNLPENSHGGPAEFIYYSFVTMTTLGYGDITPNSPLARSLSIFFSVTGQLYLTMIIAILVGKYLSRKA